MITQVINNGVTIIRIENAESLEDAKINGFPEGAYTRYFVNDKPVNNYMAMVRFIVDETKRTGLRFIPPTAKELKDLRDKVISKQNQTMTEQINKLKVHYKNSGVPEHLLKELDDTMDKINLSGLRVIE